MSDSSRGQMLISAESVFNETPSSPAMSTLRIVKDSLVPKNSTAISDEIRADRSRGDLLLVGTDVSGALDTEFPFRTFDSLIEAALCGTWTTGGDAAFADGVITGTTTLTSAGATFISGDVGKAITGTGILPGTYILSRSSGTVVILSQPASNGSSLAFTIKARTGAGNVLTNGVTNRSFLLERGYNDISQFVQLRGMVVNTWNFDLTARAKMTSSFGFMGAQATRSGTTVAASAAAATIYPPMTAGPAVTALESNTNMTGLKVKNVKFSVDNNLRLHEHVEAYASDDFGRGVMDIKISMDIYFKNGALVDVFLANTSMPLAFTITDPLTGGTYVITWPKVKLGDGAPPPLAGVDGDVMQTVAFQALYDSTAACQMKVNRT